MFILRWIWKNLKGYRLLYISALTIIALYHTMYIISPYFTQQIIDTFIFNDNAKENLQNNLPLFFAMLGGMVGFTFIRTVMEYTGIMMCEKASQGLLFRVKEYLFHNIQSQDASFYDQYRTGDIMTRLSSDLEMVRHSLAWVFRAIIESVVLYTTSAIYFFYLDPLMAICILALTPVIFGITFLFLRRIGPMYVALRDKLSSMNTSAEENISGNRVVRAFAREEYEIQRFDEKNIAYSQANKNAVIEWLKFFPYIEITAYGLSVVQLLAGGLFVIFGRLSMGEFTAFAALIWTIANPMHFIGNIINDLQRFTASANKIIEVYYSYSKILDRADAVDRPERFKGAVTFENVSFQFGGQTVLKNINLSIKPGQTIAIMGETGSGKTTLVNLIPRIYDVSSGRVLVDGEDVRMLKLKQLRKNIGIATQDVLLFSDTVEGNIAFGNIDMPMEDVIKYAEMAAADEFIRNMPEGYDTIVGERGIGLSGGQKQRIALARALAIKPAILILDDTTSAVDSETEQYIRNNLKNLDFPCTKIIIAQRISTAKNADQIIILQNGEITQTGTHDELIQTDGYYRDVYELQS